jgi:hypothetical protein
MHKSENKPTGATMTAWFHYVPGFRPDPLTGDAERDIKVTHHRSFSSGLHVVFW